MEVGGNYDKVERSVWCLPSARELLILWHIRRGGIAAITRLLFVTYLGVLEVYIDVDLERPIYIAPPGFEKEEGIKEGFHCAW